MDQVNPDKGRTAMVIMGQELKPSDTIMMSEAMLEEIMDKKQHSCFLDAGQMAALSDFAKMIQGNEDGVRALVNAAKMIPVIQKTVVGTLVIGALSGLGGLILLGAKAWAERGGR